MKKVGEGEPTEEITKEPIDEIIEYGRTATAIQTLTQIATQIQTLTRQRLRFRF